MTFSSLPHRSSSDDDALDQQLNDWVSGEHRQRHSEPAGESPREGHQHRRSERSEESPREALRTAPNLTADALEFHRWADNTRRTDPAATGPGAGTWNRVLRNSAQASPKGSGEMSTAALRTGSAGFTVATNESVGQSIRRYSSLVATIALVLAVAVGGWLAMSQLPPGGEGRFAAFQGTPEVAEAQTCDVEPLSVDRVMEIVNNPYLFAANGPSGEPTLPENPDNSYTSGLREAGWWDLALIGQGEINPPTEDEFESSSEFVNTYLECQMYGTLGQIWTFHSPIHIQEDVMSEFPVFADEDAVRARVETRHSGPAGEEGLGIGYIRGSFDGYGDLSVTVNSDRQLTLQQSVMGSQFTYVVTFGLQVAAEDDATLYLTSGTGSELIRHPSGSQRSLTVSVGWDGNSESWYIVTFAPVR